MERLERPFQIIVDLYSEESKCTRTEVVSFSSFPANFQEIKDQIEDSFSIPSCLQVLWVHGSKVHDSMTCSPSSLYLQNGDTIRVSYPMKCNVEGVKDAIKWMSESVMIFKKISHCTEEGQTTGLLVKQTYLFQSINDLDDFGSLFYPWTDKSKEINTIYFDYLGGIDLLVKFLNAIIDITENDLFSPSRSRSISDFLNYVSPLECTLYIAMANIARNSTFCRRITECGGLDTAIKMFLRTSKEPKSTMRSPGDALVAICNISDTPENHLYISKCKDMISKIPIIIGKPFEFSIWAAHDAINILLNATTCKEAHVELLQPQFVQEVIQSLNSRTLGGTEKLSVSLKVLFWYTGITLAQMVLGSTHLLQKFPEKILHSMIDLMKGVCIYDPAMISKYEVSNAITWTSFKHMLFIYEPYIPSSGMPQSPSIRQVRLLSISVLLHSFQCTMGRKESVAVAVKEDLLEYFIMLPWTVPVTHQKQARSLVREMAKFHQVQPPSLCALSKVKLANMKWGLKKLLDMSSISEIIADLKL